MFSKTILIHVFSCLFLTEIDPSWSWSWNACRTGHGHDAPKYVFHSSVPGLLDTDHILILFLVVSQWVHPRLLVHPCLLEARQACQDLLHRVSDLLASHLACLSLHLQVSVVHLVLGKSTLFHFIHADLPVCWYREGENVKLTDANLFLLSDSNPLRSE